MAIANHTRTGIWHIGGSQGGIDIVTGFFNFSTTDTGGELPLPGKRFSHIEFHSLTDAAVDQKPQVSGETTSGGWTAIPQDTGTITLLRTSTSPASGAKYTYVAYVQGATC
jgi:hypothetical protein